MKTVKNIPFSAIHPAPENDTLYRPIDPADPEVVALVGSIRKHGVMEPLILTADHFIVSGHRRYAAARLAGLRALPCRIQRDVSRTRDPDRFMELLREANRQRIKSADEKLREEVISADPDVAYQALIDHRRQKESMSHFGGGMPIGDSKNRKGISDAKLGFLNAIIGVLSARRQFWPLSDRQIHYALLNDPPLIHASKPASRYCNSPASYRALTDLLTRARLTGQIPFDCIADETRPVETWNIHRDVSGFMRAELADLFKGYWRDLLQSQPNHLELVIEKNTLLSILRPVAMKYCLPITSGRGYCSLPPRHAMAERYRRSGKGKLILLMVSDHDPDGEMIAQSFARSMRDDFGIKDILPVKVALTAEQVRTYQLPPSMKAKAGCSTRARFVAKHGENVFEVEALEPAVLQSIVDAAIDAVLDIKAFNAENDAEKQDAAALDGIRRRAIAAIGEATK